MWYRRARTLHGRLLVAQTMVLSRLWHYTQHVSIPTTVVKRWQSMLNRFVLSRKHDRDASHVQLIPREFLYLPKSDGGLGIPSLDAQLKRQRLALLLQFIRAATNASARNWTTAGIELLTSILPRYGKRQALDLLVISPLRHGAVIKWGVASTWWKATCVWWYKTRWELTWHDLPFEEQTAYGLHQQIWFHSDDALHYEQTARTPTGSSHRRCLGMVPEPQRSFRLHVSRVFGLRSLADFIRAGCAWPSQQEFVEQHIDYTLMSTTPGQQAKWLRVLYHEATQIVERLTAVEFVCHGPPTVQAAPPYLGCTVGVKVCLVPAIPRSALLRVVWTPTPPTKPHPMTVTSSRVRQEQIQSFVQYNRHLRAILLPVFEDLQFRLAFRLLPVRARFWFLETAHPRIQYCVRDGCNAIETEEHLFFECTLAAQLWHHLNQMVSPLFRTRPTWLDIVLAKKLHVRDEYGDCVGVVNDAWHALRAVTLHFIWTDRNRCLFDGRQPTPSLPALHVVFTTFAAHIRFFNRRLYGDEDKLALAKVVRAMQSQPVFGRFTDLHPGITSVRPPV